MTVQIENSLLSFVNVFIILVKVTVITIILFFLELYLITDEQIGD